MADHLDDQDDVICTLTGGVECLRRQNAKLRNCLADSIERESKLENICLQWCDQWDKKIGENFIPDLPHEKAIWNVGQAILYSFDVSDLPELPVEEMARKVIEESNAREDAVRELMKAVDEHDTLDHQLILALEKIREIYK